MTFEGETSAYQGVAQSGLERLLGVQEVGDSNSLALTISVMQDVA